MGITTQLSEFVAGISLDRLPPEVVNRARFLVLDLVGNIVRARHDAESTPSFLAAVRAMGMAAGNAGVFGDAARYTPGRRRLPQRRAGAFAGFRRHACRRLAASRRAGDPRRAGRRRDGRGVRAPMCWRRSSPATRSPAASRSPCRRASITTAASIPPPPAARSARRRRRRGCSGWTPTASPGALGTVLSQCAGSLQFLVNGAWTKRFQVGWAATQRADGGDPGARGLQGRRRGAGRPPRLPARLRAQPEAGARGAGPRHGVRTDEHGGEAVSVLPLRPCRDRRGAGAARRATT